VKGTDTIALIDIFDHSGKPVISHAGWSTELFASTGFTSRLTRNELDQMGTIEDWIDRIEQKSESASVEESRKSKTSPAIQDRKDGG
jgi:hypothetical protein